MDNIIKLFFLLFASVYAVKAYFLLSAYAVRKLEKLDAETFLLEEQASHVKQTAEVERTTLDATIKAHEKQGANKLRTEIARLGGDIPKIEALIGSKLSLPAPAVSLGSPAGSGQSSVGSP